MEKKTDRKPGKGKALAKDLLKILLCGLAVGLAVTLLLFVAGLLVGRGQIGMGLEVAKDGLFLCTSLLLFIVAGMLMIKGKKPEEAPDQNGWKRHFQVIGLKTVIAMLSISFLFWASLVDYVMLL